MTQGNNATFSVAASGTPVLFYQGHFNGTNNIAGATGSVYTRNGVGPADAGKYSVAITNGISQTNNQDAVLTVLVPAKDSVLPMDVTTGLGLNATFTCTAAGTLPLGYQWQLSGTNIARATASALTVTSLNATLAVNVPPGITAQPQSVTTVVGSNVIFTVTATGTLPLGYQRHLNGTNLANATASAYACVNAQTKDAGSYSVVVSNITGSLASADAVLTLTQTVPPQIDWLSLTSDGQVQLQAGGAPGHYGVKATTNLVDWAEWTNFTTPDATFQYLDAKTNLLQRFYRIRVIQ